MASSDELAQEVEPAIQTALDPNEDHSGLWRNSDFLKFWAGESISLIGKQVTDLALPLVTVLVLAGNAAQVGLVRFMQLLPFLLFSLLFGLWVDRSRKRPLMIVSNAVRAVVIGAVPVLYLFDVLSLPLIAIAAFAAGTCAVIFDLCWMSYVPVLVSKRHLVEANAKISTSVAVADVAGPGVAGGLVQLFTAPVALVVDAIGYLVSVVSLLWIRTAEPAPMPPDRNRHVLREILEGARWILRNPYLRVTTFVSAGYNFFYLFMEAVLIVYAVRELSFSPTLLGAVFVTGALGGLAGAATTSTFIKRFPLGVTYTASVLVGYAAPLLIAAASGSRTVVAAMIIVGVAVRGLGATVANVISISLRQAVTPQHVMGRMTAAVRLLLYGFAALGAPIGGLLGGAIGLRTALWIGAVGSLAVGLTVLGSGLPRLVALPAPPEPETAG